MRRVVAAGASTFASVVLIAVLLAGSTAPVDAATAPTPAASSAVPLTVVIPDIGQGTVPAPTPTPSRSSGGSGSSTPPVTPPPTTNPDGSPVPPTKPTEGAAKLVLDKDSLSVHDWLTATGTGYTPGEKVQFVLYPGAVVIGSYVADAAGKVVARFRIPEETRPGDHVLEATGWTSKRVMNAAFSVVTPSGAATVPWLWWVLLVTGVLLASFIALAIYYRESIRGWFSGVGVAPAASP